VLSKAWDLVFGYLKARPWWGAVEPFVLLAFGWVAAQVTAFQWLAASAAFRPSVALFLDSYVSKRITVAALGLAALGLVFKGGEAAGREPAASRVRAYWQAHRPLLLRRLVGVLLVGAAVTVGIRVNTPNRVSHVTVRLMSLPGDVTPEGVAYLVYELNRRQRHWHLEVDFRPFTEEMLTSGEAERCRGDERPRLCQAEALAAGEPFIGITAEALGGAYFGEHRRGVSVVSTFDRAAYAPLSTYEYLAYSLVLQSVSIHLDVDGGGLPEDAFAEGRRSRGGLFEFVPEKTALKAAILAARLSPEEEGLLLNRFGSDYVTTCAELLTMEWLYSPRVRGNLERVFGATLGR